ncbi:amino acid-binding protein [uncultured Methanobrevibacter sp.]|uniref:amino acid-binding protein n=1 Tax=uncultured Methanobrevibacter sp. TaxID=253161 RepID=UPI0025DA7902|nr:amino acid-binding protein [uncultured Methanobrevibacter sp.]
MATQISVFIENKEGRIKKAMDTLANAGVNIRALSVGDTTKYGILRLIVSDNETATKSLENDGFIVKESEVVVVAVPDKPNGLNSTLSILDDADINLEYIYAFVSSQPNEAIVAMKVEDTEKAIKVFEENNAKILKKEDLEKI